MTTAASIGLATGTWTIDTAHSTVGFSVRHMMVSKVRGVFREFGGAITVAEEIEQSSVQATIQASSVDTGNEQRDGHLQSADFFNAEQNTTIAFVSTGIKATGGDWVVTGDLTIAGVTKSVDLDVEFNGTSVNQGVEKAGFEASTEINRQEFGIEFQIPMEGGGIVVGDKVKITLDIEADRTA